MFVNEFESSNSYRLQQIISTLKNVHGVNLDLDSQSDSQVKSLGESCEIVKNSIVKESAFNTWMQNPEYTKNMLILEAIKIYLAEVAPKRMSKKAKKVREGAEQLEEMPSTRSIGGGAVRAWAHDKMDKDRRSGLSMKGYRPKDAPSKEELRAMGQKSQDDYLQRGGKVTREDEELDETSPDAMMKLASLGREMMDYAQSQRPDRNDEREMRILNAISQVGDKLTQVGTPFGPRELSDMDKKVIIVAKRRMGAGSMMEDAPIAPTAPTAPGSTPAKKTAPGMVNVVKGTDTKTVPAAQLASLQSQGYSIVGDEAVNEESGDDELAALMKEYGVDGEMDEGLGKAAWALTKGIVGVPAKAAGRLAVGAGKGIAKGAGKAAVAVAKGAGSAALAAGKGIAKGTMAAAKNIGPDISKVKQNVKKAYATEDEDMDEGNEFSGALAAAKAQGKSEFEVGGKTYKVDEAEAMMEAAKGPDMDKLKKKKADLEDKMDAIVKDGGKILKTDPLHKQYDKVCADIKAAKKTVNEAAHMENHDYQASMARSELYRNTKYAMDMMKMISPTDDIKPWIAANLTKSATALDKIYHYMDYYHTFEPSELPTGGATPVMAVSEDDDDLGESTGSIARQNLMMIMEYSTKLFRMIQPGDKLEGWVAMKLTNASEAISSSKHHMEYSQFEKHAGEMADDEMSHMEELPMTEAKGKNPIKEGMMVTIGNILMNSMIKEDQDLQQAQTLVAAKGMSDDLQDIAEKLAKMGVEQLMPLVDTMKEQFGQEIAAGFNDTVKAAIDAVLTSATEAKDTTDNAILSMQQGQVPGSGATDIEATGDAEAAPEAGAEGGDDFGGTPAAAGPAEEPLGRAKKDTSGEAPPTLEEAKKMSAKQAAIFGKKSDKKAAGKDDKKAKPDFLDVDKDGDKKEPMTKALKDKAAKEKKKDVKESKVEEKAPPGKKAEDFIKSNKAGFKKLYGKDWESKLYATAWKKFGPKSENLIKTAKMLEAAKANKASMVKAFESHKKTYAKMVNEGVTSDVLNTGYGLEGQTMLDQITDVDSMIVRLKEMLRSEMKAGIHDIIMSEETTRKIESLAESKSQAPWGVVWKVAGKKMQQKFFESEDLRKYWMDLNKSSLTESKLVNPADFDKRIQALNSRKG